MGMVRVLGGNFSATCGEVENPKSETISNKENSNDKERVKVPTSGSFSESPATRADRIAVESGHPVFLISDLLEISQATRSAD